MNRIILIGNLTKDPELKATPAGISVCTFTIAVNKRVSREAASQGAKDADFFNIVVWRQQAENCAKYLSKGRKVGIVGSISTRTYEQDGVKRYFTEVTADDVEFLSPAGERTGASDANAAQSPYPQEPARSSAYTEGVQPVDTEELPF